MQCICRICIYDLKHLLGNLRIKLRSHMLFNFSSDLFLRHIASVAAVGGHRVIAVSNGYDTGKAGIGTDIARNEINLPQTGRNSVGTAAAAGSALLLTAAGL